MKKITFRTAPVRHILLVISIILVGSFHLLKNNTDLMKVLAKKVIKPVRMVQSFISSVVSFSIAEVMIALAAIILAAYLMRCIVRFFKLKFRRNEESRETAYKLFLTLVTFAVGVYAGFCILWGVNYYGDDFVRNAGLKNTPVSVEQLETVTQYFSDLANGYSSRVHRNLQGICEMDRNEILKKSTEVYKKIERRYPFLLGPNIPAKGIRCSKVMSLTNFTGFFFPFTGEANVNMDSPSFMLPSTVAHELAHCRGVSKEQEANFVAVLACMGFGDDEYIYSASLMAYSYLSDSLYSADYDAWLRVSSGLNNDVKRDFAADDFYWSKYRTPVSKVSDAVYEGFLQSYDQKLGLKSYGACVDLLVNYYYPLVSK